MKIKILFIASLMMILISSISSEDKFMQDVIKTKSGDIKITFIGHATLMLNFKNIVIHIDPVSSYADYSKLQKADIILVTHEHGDHFDAKAIEAVSKNKTEVILTEKCKAKFSKSSVMKNGETKTIQGIKIEAIPAYNIVNMRKEVTPYHPKGDGNGYILTIDDKVIYIAGDTENTPEMKALKNIDVAFLPMNLPYTMTPEMAADAAIAFKPKILYPYHFGEPDTSKLIALLKENKEIEVRIRNMK